MTVTILGAAHPVVLPPRFAERRELLSLAYGNPQRGAAMALALCCPSLKVKAAYMVHALGVTAEVAGRAWEELSTRGVTDMDMFAAAQPIIGAVDALAFPLAAEVAAAEDFTVPSGAPVT